MTLSQQWIRHEIKYRVDRCRVEAIKHYLRNILEVDPNAKSSAGYLNYSVYFDTPAYRFLNEKEEGLKTRTKPRLRVYKEIETGKSLNYFFELKHRSGASVLKERTQIDRALAQNFLSHGAASYPLDRPIIGHFAYLERRYQLEPAVCVLYRRQAYKCPLYPGLRVTFDSHLSASLAIGLDTPVETCFPVLPANETIVEIKYNQSRPNVISEMVKRLELQQLSFSKYVVSIQSAPHARGLTAT